LDIHCKEQPLVAVLLLRQGLLLLPEEGAARRNAIEVTLVAGVCKGTNPWTAHGEECRMSVERRETSWSRAVVVFIFFIDGINYRNLVSC
jgi:hypothetical protein